MRRKQGKKRVAKPSDLLNLPRIFHRGACGKVKYPSGQIARAKLKWMLASGVARYKKGSLEVYYCEECEAHHLGNSTWRVGATA